jgi:hypothetical protein
MSPKERAEQPQPPEPTPPPEPPDTGEPAEPAEQPEPEPAATPNPEAIAAARERDEAAAAAELEPEPEPAGDVAEQADDTDRAIVAAQALYITTVVDTLGPDAEVIPCPTCHGFAFLSAVLPMSETHEQCPACHGRGHVRTGSLVESQRELSCERCQGNGWTRKAAPIQLPGGATEPVVQPGTASGGDQLAPLTPPAPSTLLSS